MKKKVVTGTMLTLLILSMLTFAFNVQPVKASGTIYIRADGSVDPPTAPITSADNVTYTFTDNINDSIVVQRSNITVNGNGYTLQGSGSGNGFYLSDINNVTIKNTNIKNFSYGVYLYSSCKYNTVSGNTITNSKYHGVHLYSSCKYNTISRNTITNSKYYGVYLYSSCKYNTVSGNTITNNTYHGVYVSSSSNNNTVSGNTITNNGYGVYLSSSCKYNTVSGNTITNNNRGVYLSGSPNNIIYHNNFINNTVQVYTSRSKNVWDDGYPSGGNYWSDYNGTDLYSGPYQNETGSDGIGDTPYVIDRSNQDNYPLMEPWSPPAGSTRYPWSMFHHNLRHTGYTESPAPNTNQTLWNYTTGGDVQSSPAVADGMVFVGSNGNVYALDQYTGAHIWNYTTGYAVISSPAVADGTVYVGCLDSNVYALNETTGELIWSYTTGSSIYSSPAVAEGSVFIGSRDGKVHALNAGTGTLIWNYTTGGSVDSSPAVANGMVFIGSGDHNVYALSASTGELIWSYTTGNRVWRSSPTVVDGVVFVGSEDSNVYALNAITGVLIWSYTTGWYVWSSPAVADGMVFVGSHDRYVYALNQSTGAFIWRYMTGGYVTSSPAVADGKVYVGSYDDKVYCLDASTGAHIWDYTTGGDVDSSPAVADGMLFIGSNDRAVYAFGNIVRVPEDYPTIAKAIEAATPEATIIIAPGIYYESVTIDKTLTILGGMGSAPIFSGGGSGIAITLLLGASGSTIAGIVITNWDQGILVINASNCKIYDNIMSLMNQNGIVLEGNNAANNLIYSNIFEDNTIAINLTASSTTNIIYKNIICTNNIGLNLETDGNVIYANTISENQIGIDLSNSNNNIIYHNNFINNIQNAKTEALFNIWDNGYPSGGNYWSTHTSPDQNSGPNQNQPGSDGIVDTNYTIAVNNVDRYPLVQPFNPHDMGITNVIPSKTIVGQGYTLRIDLKILNYGVYNETFTVTTYANTTIIATQTITLTRRNSTTIAFTWNTAGFAKGNYTISAYAWPVLGETDTADNNFTDGVVWVKWPYDVTGDGYCGIDDIVIVAEHFGTDPTSPNWDPRCDISGDNYVGIDDIVSTAEHFGQTDP